jgi:hypothetical protein
MLCPNKFLNYGGTLIKVSKGRKRKESKLLGAETS